MSDINVAEQIIAQIEERFPNWRSYRDLVDCIDCTLHELRSGHLPDLPQTPLTWQPITTAPRDGTDVLLWAESWEMSWGIQIGHYGEDCWHTSEGKASDNEEDFDPDADVDDEENWEDRNLGPTHWMPLPTSPLSRPKSV